MKIGIIGASGKSGIALTKEALHQGYQVVAITCNPNKMPNFNHDSRLTIKKADLTNKQSVIKVIDNIDILISAYGPTADHPQALHQKIAETLIAIMHECQNLKRLLIIGGAGSLLNNNNEMIIETSIFPIQWKEHAWKQIQALTIFKDSAINWTYFSPSLNYNPSGSRTGKFKIANDHLITDQNGKSEISYADAAIAVIDEIKNHQFVQKRFTAGYEKC